MTKVKICGITTARDARAVVDSGADFIGVVLSRSPRRVTIEQVPGIIESAGRHCRVVGVFAEAGDLLAYDALGGTPLDYYQVYFDHAGLMVRPPRRGWITSFRLTSFDHFPHTNGELLRLYDFKSGADSAVGGCPPEQATTIRERSFIAGKLTVETVSGVVASLQPFGVDVARGTESAPGVKDLSLVEQFVKKVQNASER